MRRFAIYALLAAAALVALLYTSPANNIAVGIWTGIVTGLLIPIVDQIVSKWGRIRLAISLLSVYRQEVRISFSYLIRIRHGNSYFLIRGNRYPNNFQPVGGVYKFAPSARARFTRWGVLDDDLIPIDQASSDDLRLRVPAKRILRFLQWFESGQEREVGVWREFYEEIVASGLVQPDHFRSVNVEFVRTHIEPLRYSPQAGRKELMLAHIFQLTPTPAQEQELRLLGQSGGRADAGWFSEEEIRRQGATPGQPQQYSIPPTASWTL